MEYLSAASQLLDSLIRAALSGTEIDQDEVYRGESDEGAAYPNVTFHLVTSPETRAAGGSLAFAKPLYLVRCWGRADQHSPEDLQPAVSNLYAALSAIELTTVDGYVLEGWADERGAYEDDHTFEGVRYFCRGAFFRLFVQPA